MLISHSNKFIFVHIQKTGGSTVEHILQTQVPDTEFLGHRHNFVRNEIDTVNDHKDYFKFAFVRNPWARLLSWWSMYDEARRVTWRDRLTSARARNLYQLTKKYWFWQYVHKHGKTFDDFILQCTGVVGSKMPGGVSSITFNQLDYIADEEDNLLVDFVGRFENFQEDLRKVGQRIELDLNSIPWTNRTKHKHYSEYYTNETRAVVAEIYQRDIEYFGYKFDPPSDDLS